MSEEKKTQATAAPKAGKPEVKAETKTPVKADLYVAMKRLALKNGEYIQQGDLIPDGVIPEETIAILIERGAVEKVVK